MRSEQPASKGMAEALLLTAAVGGLLSFLASLVALLLSYHAIGRSFAIVEDPGLDPRVKAALLKDSIDTAMGWSQFGLLVWPIGSVLVCAIAFALLVHRRARQRAA